MTYRERRTKQRISAHLKPNGLPEHIHCWPKTERFQWGLHTKKMRDIAVGISRYLRLAGKTLLTASYVDTTLNTVTQILENLRNLGMELEDMHIKTVF